ncbi:hypothetical protein TELCIR_11840, partial [Teladorsagia circumcincta]
FIQVCHAVYSNCYTTNYTKYSCKRRVMILIDGTPPKESILRRVHSNVYNEYPNEALEKLDAVTDFANLAICGGHGIHNKRTTAATIPKPAMTATTAPGPTDIPPSLTTITTAVKSTAEPTSTTTVRSTIKHITTTRSPKATSCDCSPESVWLDIFILMDASVHMTLNGIESATDYMMSAFAKMTIGQGERFQTRVGVIRYATNVKLIADLNVYKSTADYTSATDLSDLDISMAKETGTNIEGSNPELKQDWIFKKKVIEYVQEHGITVPMLQKLASPNFSLTTEKKDGSELHAQELRQLLCEANCFCKKNWMPFNTNKWNAPYGGCYYKSPANAVQYCSVASNIGVLSCTRNIGVDDIMMFKL